MERNFFKTKTLEYFENLDERKANVNLITNLYSLKNALNAIFPDELFPTIGAKLEIMSQNVFINDFYYKIFN